MAGQPPTRSVPATFHSTFTSTLHRMPLPLRHARTHDTPSAPHTPFPLPLGGSTFRRTAGLRTRVTPRADGVGDNSGTPPFHSSGYLLDSSCRTYDTVHINPIGHAGGTPSSMVSCTKLDFTSGRRIGSGAGHGVLSGWHLPACKGRRRTGFGLNSLTTFRIYARWTLPATHCCLLSTTAPVTPPNATFTAIPILPPLRSGICSPHTCDRLAGTAKRPPVAHHCRALLAPFTDGARHAGMTGAAAA